MDLDWKAFKTRIANQRVCTNNPIILLNDEFSLKLQAERDREENPSHSSTQAVKNIRKTLLHGGNSSLASPAARKRGFARRHSTSSSSFYDDSTPTRPPIVRKKSLPFFTRPEGSCAWFSRTPSQTSAAEPRPIVSEKSLSFVHPEGSCAWFPRTASQTSLASDPDYHVVERDQNLTRLVRRDSNPRIDSVLSDRQRKRHTIEFSTFTRGYCEQLRRGQVDKQQRRTASLDTSSNQMTFATEVRQKLHDKTLDKQSRGNVAGRSVQFHKSLLSDSFSTLHVLKTWMAI